MSESNLNLGTSQRVYHINDTKIMQFIDDLNASFNHISYRTSMKSGRGEKEYIVNADDLDEHLPKNDKATALIFNCLYPIKEDSVKQTMLAIYNLNLVRDKKYNIKPFIEFLSFFALQDYVVDLTEEEHSKFFSLYKELIERIEEYAQQHIYEVENWDNIVQANFKAFVEKTELPYKNCKSPAWWDCYQDHLGFAKTIYQSEYDISEPNIRLVYYLRTLWDFWDVLAVYDTTYNFLLQITTMVTFKETASNRYRICRFLKEVSEEWKT